MSSIFRYKLAENIIDANDIDALIKWLREGKQLTKGELTLRFEEEWARWIGTKYAVFCNSGSSANLLASYAMKVSRRLGNNKVIVPSVGWVTTISPFLQFGFKPYMCGADENSFALDNAHLEKLLKKYNPAAVVLVQVLGVPGSMEELLRLKKKYGFMLMEDACAALGAEYGSRKIGTFGDLATFSFFFGHQLSTIEGGMVNTNDKELYNLLLMLRSHGWGKDLDEKTRSKFMKKYNIEDFHKPFTFFVPGFNLRSTDLQAFLGLRMMAKADKIVSIRRRNHDLYASMLKNVEYQKWDSQARPCSISFGALAQSSNHRKNIVSELVKNGIETRLFSAGNLGLHPFWFEHYGKFNHPVSNRVHQLGFFLPNNESLTPSGVKYICDIVNGI